jgi:hypothetical protein
MQARRHVPSIAIMLTSKPFENTTRSLSWFSVAITFPIDFEAVVDRF